MINTPGSVAFPVDLIGGSIRIGELFGIVDNRKGELWASFITDMILFENCAIARVFSWNKNRGLPLYDKH